MRDDKKMKIGFAVIILLYALSFLACTTDVNDCICSTEFRTYDVIVLDSSGNPIDSLVIRITDSFGKEFSSNGSFFNPAYNSEGKYWIMDDSYIQEFSIRPATIFLEGTKDNKSIEAAFLFNTDECKCHISKLAGPDTVIAQ